MLPLLPLALLARPQTPSPEPELFEFGQLRHVQLLQPRGNVVRFATQIEVGTIEGHWAMGKDTYIAVFEGDSAEPVAEMAVGTSIVPVFTWTERPGWFLMELGESTVLALLVPDLPEQAPTCNHDRVERTLLLLTYPRGDEIRTVPGVLEIEDGLVRDGRGDLLVRRGGQLLWLQLSEAGEIVREATIEPGVDRVACAAFVRGEPGEELRAWSVGWKETGLLAVPLGTQGADHHRSFRFTFDGGSANDVVDVGEMLRAAAWVQQSRSHLAVSWPDYDIGVGKLQVIDVSVEPEVLWEGRPYPEVIDDTSDQRDYGHAIAFVPDRNGDGVPDVLVSGPCEFDATNIDLLSGLTGELLKTWTPGLFRSTGHSLSLSADARHVLVGGAEFRAYPEDLTEEGQAHLLDAVTLERLQTWRSGVRAR